MGHNRRFLSAHLSDGQKHQHKPSADQKPAQHVSPSAAKTQPHRQIGRLKPGQNDTGDQPNRWDIDPLHSRTLSFLARHGDQLRQTRIQHAIFAAPSPYPGLRSSPGQTVTKEKDRSPLHTRQFTTLFRPAICDISSATRCDRD